MLPSEVADGSARLHNPSILNILTILNNGCAAHMLHSAGNRSPKQRRMASSIRCERRHQIFATYVGSRLLSAKSVHTGRKHSMQLGKAVDPAALEQPLAFKRPHQKPDTGQMPVQAGATSAKLHARALPAVLTWQDKV